MDAIAYFLWRFMIGEQYQGRGYWRKALELFLAHVKTCPGADAVETTCVPAKGGPGPFYEKMGFVYTERRGWRTCDAT
jgi:diamine N-acetyltransferase